MEIDKEGLSSFYSKLEEAYRKKTPRSLKLFERGKKVFPDGVTYSIRMLSPYPPYMVEGRGSKIKDVDGNVYTDYWMGHGALFLGHAPPEIMGVVSQQLSKGTHFGYENEIALNYAELLTRILPNAEQIKFTNSGTESNYFVLRLARVYTKRLKVVKVEGGWHGAVEQLHYNVTYPYEGFESAGIPPELEKYIISIPFNDLEAAEKALKARDVAAIFVEPVLGAGGGIDPDKDYLKGLRELCDQYDTLLIFDEVITGFRLALGGAQEYYNVKADIVVLGKIIGGGIPGAGAFAGPYDIMKYVERNRPKRERAYHSGTFSGNPLTTLAGYTTIKYLMEHRELYDHANSLGEYIRREIDKIGEETGVPLFSTGAGSIVGIHFTKKRPRNHREAFELRWGQDNLIEKTYNIYMRVNDIIYISESLAHLLLSVKHTQDDVKKFVDLTREYVEEVKKYIKSS
jgi:glutamate-1-semialdehyde 2,1-aminomutase